MNFVGNLTNKTDNKILESRSDGIKIYKDINAVVITSPTEFTQNHESFHRYIHQWSSSIRVHHDSIFGLISHDDIVAMVT